MKLNINMRTKITSPGLKSLSKSQITKALLDDLCIELNKKMLPNRRNIRHEIRQYVKTVIMTHITAQNLVDGATLAADFGIEYGRAIYAINKIGETLYKSTYVGFNRFKRKGNTIVGGVRFGIIKDDYSDVLSLPEAITINNSKRNVNQKLPWLDWLLRGGSGIIVRDFRIQYRTGAGRSEGAIMLESPGNGWRVPPMFEGVEDDNWFTQCFTSGPLTDSTTYFHPEFHTFLDNLMTKYFS
jgi:hypothetical protein